MKKTIAEAFETFANARNFGDVNSSTENHGSIVAPAWRQLS
jgi:hypothetical protein